MKYVSETKALTKLQAIKDEFAVSVRREFEYKAKSCLTCETKGACCLDAHFVNVHITRLEAVAIQRRLAELPEEKKREIYRRIDETIGRYRLTDPGDTFAKTFACPLFERDTGCMVHAYGKPLACITHACYETEEDLPPDELLAAQESEIDKLNQRVYGKRTHWLPIPVAIKELAS